MTKEKPREYNLPTDMVIIYSVTTTGDEFMDKSRKFYNVKNFDTLIREYLKEGRGKLEKELVGTREAIKMIAKDKTKEFIQTMDRGLDKDEREFLSTLIVSSMYQAFCYGYGIGKIEGKNNNKVFL